MGDLRCLERYDLPLHRQYNLAPVYTVVILPTHAAARSNILAIVGERFTFASHGRDWWFQDRDSFVGGGKFGELQREEDRTRG